MIRLDDVLHLPSAPDKPIVQHFFHQQVTRGLEEIEKTKLTRGARLWKSYSHSWTVRTPSVTVAFDLVPGPPRNEGFALPVAILKRLVRQSYVLFISHLHSDHASRAVARMFLQQGKKVAASEGLWNDDPEFAGRLIYPQRSADKVHALSLRRHVLGRGLNWPVTSSSSIVGPFIDMKPGEPNISVGAHETRSTLPSACGDSPGGPAAGRTIRDRDSPGFDPGFHQG